MPDAFDLLITDESHEYKARGEAPLRSWAPAVAAAPRHARVGERIAALSLARGPLNHELLEWAARHPLLTLPQLTTLLGHPSTLLARHLKWLERCGAVRALPPVAGGETPLVPTHPALQLLAAEADVPGRRFDPTGVGRWFADAAPGARYRRLEHDLGVNRAFVRLHADASRVGGAAG